MNKIHEQLLRDEGLRLKPYKCTGDKLTIGVGRNLDDVGISEDEAMMLLENDIQKVRDQLTTNKTFYGVYQALDEVRFAALMNMTFQLGFGGVAKFRKALDAMQKQDWETAAKEMLDSRWAKQTPDRAKRVAEQMRTGEWK